MEPLGPVTQGVLVSTAMLLAVASLMIVLSIALPPSLSRWFNIVVGLCYTGLVLLIAIGGGWVF